MMAYDHGLCMERLWCWQKAFSIVYDLIAWPDELRTDGMGWLWSRLAVVWCIDWGLWIIVCGAAVTMGCRWQSLWCGKPPVWFMVHAAEGSEDYTSEQGEWGQGAKGLSENKATFLSGEALSAANGSIHLRGHCSVHGTTDKACHLRFTSPPTKFSFCWAQCRWLVNCCLLICHGLRLWKFPTMSTTWIVT